MTTDPEFLRHQLAEAVRSGIAEEMEVAIEDLLLALKSEEVAIVWAQGVDDEYTADGLSLRDEAAFEDLEDLGLDMDPSLEYDNITSITEIED